MITEKILHRNICSYIKLQYPKTIFITDSSGIRVSVGEATRLKKLRSCNGIPDIIIFEPTGLYAGLFLEVKAKTPYRRDGELYTDQHLREQKAVIDRLNKLGYHACFVWNFEMARKIINRYMDEKNN